MYVSMLKMEFINFLKIRLWEIHCWILKICYTKLTFHLTKAIWTECLKFDHVSNSYSFNFVLVSFNDLTVRKI